MNKANQLRQEWKKDIAKGTIRENQMDEERLNELIKKEENKKQ